MYTQVKFSLPHPAIFLEVKQLKMCARIRLKLKVNVLPRQSRFYTYNKNYIVVLVSGWGEGIFYICIWVIDVE